MSVPDRALDAPMTGARAPSPSRTGMDRRAFLGRTAAVGAATWAAPAVLSLDPVAAATGSCNGLTVCEFTSGLEGWTIDNSWGSGVNGLWGHNTEASRDGGSLHYGRGTTGNYETGNSRNSGRVYSPQFEIPSTGTNTVRFTVWREVEAVDPGYDRFRLRILGSPNQTLYQAASIGNTAGFETHTITLSNAHRGDTVRFQFDFDTRDRLYNNFEGVYIGRFEVTACQPAGAGALAPMARSAGGDPLLEDPDDDEPVPGRR